tara:strand:- start:3504 stop:3656 length:153 start_codon:yes stop_codon:yes gene_type:complete
MLAPLANPEYPNGKILLTKPRKLNARTLQFYYNHCHITEIEKEDRLALFL